MIKNISELNIVRIGSDITYSSLKKIGAGILESFRDFIKEVNFSHHDSPVVESVDAQLLTMIRRFDENEYWAEPRPICRSAPSARPLYRRRPPRFRGNVPPNRLR